MAQAGGSFGNVLNPKPATNEGHPPSLSQREKGRTRTGFLAGLLSQTEPSKGRLTASLACVPAPRNGKLPSPWLPGHTQKNVGEGLGSSLGAAGVLPSILFGGSDPKPLPRSPNFTNNPSTCSLRLLRSQSAQAHPFPHSAFFQLLGHPKHPRSRGAPFSCPFVSSSVGPGPGPWTLAVFRPEVSPGSPRVPTAALLVPGRCPASSLLPGASCAGAVNGRRAHLGSPGAGRA